MYLTDEDCENQIVEKERPKRSRLQYLQNERRGRREEAEVKSNEYTGNLYPPKRRPICFEHLVPKVPFCQGKIL